VGRMVANYSIEPIDEKFSCQGRYFRLPDLAIAYGAASAVRTSWTHIKSETRDGQGFVLAMSLTGAARLSQRGRERTIPGGSSLLFSTADALRLERTASSFLLIGVPHSALWPTLADPDAAMMSVISSTIEPLRLLNIYIDFLIKNPSFMETVELRRLAVNHVHDLIALGLGATRDAAEIAAGRGLRAARIRAIKADIAQNLGGDINVAALSARHGVSPRYIRKLFEGENTSLSQFVLVQRLTRVHRMLGDLRYANRTISDIALAAGFRDLSTFNREFRRRFGLTPSEVRRGMR
jgi:AraC-like DNA-binding protein